MTLILLCIVGALACLQGVARGQEGARCPQCAIDGAYSIRDPKAELPESGHAPLLDNPDPWTLHKRVDEVTVFFTAVEGRRFVPGLVPEDIRVKDADKPARISAFGYQWDMPLRLGLAVDTSNSVNPQFRYQQKAAIQFLRQVVRPNLDRAFVLGFANDINLTQDFSDDPEQLAAGVEALRIGGGTALFDTIYSACDKLTTQDSDPTARILIVLSDGDDNSSKVTLNRAIEKAQIQEVTVYTLNTSSMPRGSGIELSGRRALKRLAEETGGRFFYQLSKHEVTRVFATIEEEMRNRYALSYRPSDLQEDGRFHRIEIAAEKSGRRFRVHTRRGYYARAVAPPR